MAWFNKNNTVLQLLTLILGSTLVSGLQAAESDSLEEIVVTGSYIKGSPEDAAWPVDVINRADLEAIGDPTIIELVRNLGMTWANGGESNTFSSRGHGAGGGVP